MNTSGHQLSTRDVSFDGGKSVLKTAGKFGATIWKQKALKSGMEEREEMSNRIEAPQSPANFTPMFPLAALLPAINPQAKLFVFSNQSVLHIGWPKYWSFSFSINPTNEHRRVISFRMDWLDLLAVQGSLKSFPVPQFKSINFWRSVFFIVQLSHPYMTTRKTIALMRQTFVDKVMSLLFNMLSRLVITFLPRSKCLLRGLVAQMVKNPPAMLETWV